MPRLNKDYFAQVFDPVLLLAFLSSLVGIAAAASYGSIDAPLALAAVVGSVLAQISVNMFNDYQDYASGIDKVETKTRFSGGSKYIASGAVKHVHVLYIGILAAALAGIIGIYLAIAVNVMLFAIIAVGAASILLYTRYIMKLPFMAEFFVMLAFALIGVGSYAVAHGSFTNLNAALYAIVPAGIIIGAVLLVNEVPDAEIDKKFGRRHAVIVINSNGGVSAYYIGLISISYAIVILGVINSALNPFFLFALVTLPAMAHVAVGIMNYRNPQSFEKYMAFNVMCTLLYLMVLIVAYSF